jgi:hypothetical protein
VSKKELIALAELNPNSYPLNAEQEQNLKELQKRLIAFRKLWAKPMIITSGFRTIEDQMRIYRNKSEFQCSPVISVVLQLMLQIGMGCSVFIV